MRGRIQHTNFGCGDSGVGVKACKGLFGALHWQAPPIPVTFGT